MLPKVWRMPATVPNNPNSGNHSAAWAKLVIQRSGPLVEGGAAPLEGTPGQQYLR